MFENLSDDELVRRTFNFSQGAKGESAQDLSPELTRRLLDSNKVLNESIMRLNKSTELYSKILIWLTIAMLIFVGIQIYILIK